jgi:fibronectin type 3 domain-containing protein
MMFDFPHFFPRAWRLGRFLALVLACFAGGAGRLQASQSVVLTWNPSPSPGLIGYNVFFGTQSGVYFDSILITNETSVTIPGLEDGQTYYFAVTAVDGSYSESPVSNEAVYTVPAPTSIALQVQGTTAASQAVAVSWTPSPDVDAYEYEVSYGTEPGAYANSVTFYGTTNGVISGLDGGETYYFVVSPIDSFGVEAVASSAVAYTVPATVPIVLTAQPAVDSPGVELGWNDIPNEGIMGYDVYYGTQSGVYTDTLNYGAVSNILVEGLDGGQTYYFRVASVDSYGNESFYSNEAASEAAYPVRLGLQVTASPLTFNTVEATWTASPDTNVSGYAIYCGTESGVFDNYDAFYGATNGLLTGLDAGVTYYFAVAPIDAYGLEEVASRTIRCVVPAVQPTALTAQAVTNPAGVELTWIGVTNAALAGYYVDYGPQSGVYDYAQFSAGTSALVQGLDAGQTYYIAVTAVDNFGDQSLFSNEAVIVAPTPPGIILQLHSYTDASGQPYLLEINTPTPVYGHWEMDSSTDLQNWTPYTVGYGFGLGDGDDVDVWVNMDSSQPQMFFRVWND